MGKNNLNKVYRLTVTEDGTERSIRSYRFTKLGLILSGITAFVVVVGGLYALIALTPLRTTIPGYPDAHFRREAVENAIKIDSLESAITRWKLWSENLTRVLSGDKTLNLDSLLQAKEAADSLRAVSDDVKVLGFRLKIYDAYRPQRAVDHFVRWAADVPDTLMKTYFYPDLDKSVLFDQEYIMAKSGHTRGSTVDLTLFDMKTEKELDMGGTFDWFGPESHPDFCGDPDTGLYSPVPSPQGRTITQEQFENRLILRRAMLRHGFKPLDSEWWHFTLRQEPFPETYFDIPVEQLHRCK